jgi:hypothetical protein
MNKLFFTFLIISFALISSCEKPLDYAGKFPGFWQQTAILENGSPVALSPCEQEVRMLVEKNGIYRLYSSCDTLQRYGTWIITNDDMLDLSMDHWNGSNKYEPYPVRFTVTKLSGSELEIRIKTFVGDRKKLVLFTPMAQDITAGKTAEELLALDRENKVLKTYIFRFTKQN